MVLAKAEGKDSKAWSNAGSNFYETQPVGRYEDMKSGGRYGLHRAPYLYGEMINHDGLQFGMAKNSSLEI